MPISLGQVAYHLSLLDLKCDRCGRSGRFRVGRLLARHGPDLPLPTLRRILAANCPKMQAQQAHDVCGAHFPGLSTLKLGTLPRSS
jgi:hypothetical protein